MAKIKHKPQLPRVPVLLRGATKPTRPHRDTRKIPKHLQRILDRLDNAYFEDQT